MIQTVLIWKHLKLHIFNLEKAFDGQLSEKLYERKERVCVTRLIDGSRKERISDRIRKLLMDEGITAKFSTAFLVDLLPF